MIKSYRSSIDSMDGDDKFIDGGKRFLCKSKRIDQNKEKRGREKWNTWLSVELFIRFSWPFIVQIYMRIIYRTITQYYWQYWIMIKCFSVLPRSSLSFFTISRNLSKESINNLIIHMSTRSTSRWSLSSFFPDSWNPSENNKILGNLMLQTSFPSEGTKKDSWLKFKATRMLFCCPKIKRFCQDYQDIRNFLNVRVCSSRGKEKDFCKNVKKHVR